MQSPEIITDRNQCWNIREIIIDDDPQTNDLLKKLHIETYENPAMGVTREMLAARFDRYTPEQQRERLERRIEAKDSQAYVARVGDTIVGMVAPRIDEGGIRRIGALYVDTEWQGTGLADELMQKALAWHDSDKNNIELHVVSYNERAKAFYRKWGFEEVAGSESLFDDTILEVKMLRKAKT